MARYAHMWNEEREAHIKTRDRLIVANDLVESLREFVQAKGLQGELLEFIIARHLGESEAKRILGTDEQSPRTGNDDNVRGHLLPRSDKP